ncbi:MAG: inositol monophosphatase [Deltaproteobacteria bacterium]|nr:inositol monophosphatase [Deltaproteobacteria bacterium]
MAETHEPIEDLREFAVEVIRRSGDQALAYYGKGRSDTKFDEGLVTEAELHLEEFFKNQLFSRFPEHQVYKAEEAEKSYTHEGKRYLWVYDAIDGVANYQSGIPIWGTSIALVENFWPVLGLFYMPTTGDLFHAGAGRKAFRGNQQICISPQEAINDESLLLTYSRFHEGYRSGFPGKIRALGCTAAHICYVAMGRAEAALLSNESYKNLAAAAVIIDAAGGKIFKMDGTEFFLGDYVEGRKIEDHLLALAPDKYAQIRRFLVEVH